MNKELLTAKFKEYRTQVIGVVATLVCVGIYFIRTGPAGDLENQFSDLNREVELLLSNQRSGVDLAANLETIKQYTGLMDERFISQNLADIHDVFYTLERESGVAMESFHRPEMLSEPFKPIGNDLEYQPLSMAVTISGKFKNVIKFVRALENSPLLYRYKALKVSSKTKSTDTISLTLNLELLSLNDK